jgi:hypothetical protein
VRGAVGRRSRQTWKVLSVGGEKWKYGEGEWAIVLSRDNGLYIDNTALTHHGAQTPHPDDSALQNCSPLFRKIGRVFFVYVLIQV